MHEPEWKTSTHSAGNGQCVQASGRVCSCGVISVRDSKDPGGPRLYVSPSAWRDLLHRIKRGDLDL
jgi:hypothetical protein